MAVQLLIDRLANAVINPIIALLFSAAFLVFLWGIFEFVYYADDENAREKGKQHLLYGIIGMVIMVGAVGIVRIIQATVGQ